MIKSLNKHFVQSMLQVSLVAKNSLADGSVFIIKKPPVGSFITIYQQIFRKHVCDKSEIRDATVTLLCSYLP